MTKPAPKQDHKPDNPVQSQRFIDMARELGAEGTEADFDRAFAKVLTAKKAAPPAPKKRKKRRSA